MDGEQRKFIRQIVRQVHPDLFSAHPFERSRNAESLKTLNAYVDALARGQPAAGGSVEFWVKEGDTLMRVQAELPSYGSLGPLFFAFGLIGLDDLKRGLGNCSQGADDRDFLLWLKDVVSEAIAAADQHEQLKRNIRRLRTSIEEEFRLVAVQVGGEFAVSPDEQRRQIEALETLQDTLTQLTQAHPGRFEGLSIRLYHPDTAPMDTSHFMELGPLTGGLPSMTCHVADDGCLHIVAEPRRVLEAVDALDLAQARLLTRLSTFWVRRVRELTPALKEVLGIENVWCDTRTESSSQRFVLWAGYLLEAAAAFKDALAGQTFAFSLLVHSDTSAPLVDFLSSSSVLQVRCDCPPQQLLEFLLSASAAEAHESADALSSIKEQEEAMLEAVQAALGAKHVIRVCSSYDQDKILACCQRLLDNASAIRDAVSLAGVSIAIDDCYELWESGFISIPYDFEVKDLQPQLQKLLAASSSVEAADAAHAAAMGGADVATAAAVAAAEAAADAAAADMFGVQGEDIERLVQGVEIEAAARAAAAKSQSARPVGTKAVRGGRMSVASPLRVAPARGGVMVGRPRLAAVSPAAARAASVVRL